MHPDPITILPDGSHLAEIRSKQAQHTRSRIPLEVIGDLPLATHIPVRLIEYRINGHADEAATSETYRLITTILDPTDASAEELADTYQQRWELEGAFKEIECYLRAGREYARKHPNWSARNSGDCSWPITR